ncbi:hypothetical protein KQX54_003362 [Cotesia glomerata]|uniref:Uncharacterized protein n=1 Tax=Cotesia glomerata TaxID=32391 RepID=A0AAV7HQL4_COTGL|nr:hypothetical protein KQX54_003362 [Cotesia glomerata]
MSTIYFALIDFHEYFLPTGACVIKEWSVTRIRPDQPIDSQHHVTKPICPWYQLNKVYQDHYNKKYKEYGVEWSVGTISLDETRQYLADFLSKAAMVYTRTIEKVNILTKFLDVQLKIRPVNINPDLCPKVQAKMSYVIIGFQDYILPNDEYAFKEVTIFKFDDIFDDIEEFDIKSPWDRNLSVESTLTTFVVRPEIDWLYLPNNFKKYYKELEENHGNEWDSGIMGSNFARR